MLVTLEQAFDDLLRQSAASMDLTPSELAKVLVESALIGSLER